VSEKKISHGLKLGLELGPVAAFFAGFVLLKGMTFTLFGTEYSGFIVMTAVFIPLMIASSTVLWYLTGKLSKMQVATLVLVIVFGGLSVWLNDERFFKMKPTMIYALFAAILGVGLLRGQSYLKVVMEEALPLQEEGWMILTRRLTAFFVALAVANEVVWRTMSTETWVSFKTFGLTVALFLFFMTQAKVIEKYGVEDSDPEKGS
jgi:intracellular septation protein